jgi:Xaa-Pro dipeptidase
MDLAAGSMAGAVGAEPLTPLFWRSVLDRLRAKADAEGLDGVLVLDANNITYATGFFHIPNERPLGLYVPVAGEPMFLVAELEREHAGATWITDVRTYPEFPGEEHPILWMVREIGVRRLGVDTLEGRMLRKLEGTLDKLVLTDAVDELRMIKTKEELALVRAAAGYADFVLDTVKAQAADIIKQGGTEQDILAAGFAAAQAKMRAELGGRFGGAKNGLLGTVHTGERAAFPHGKTLARTPLAGEPMIVGIGASVGGYHAESAATFVLGQPNADQLRCLKAATACNDAGVDALKVGATCESVNRAAIRALEDAGLADTIRHRIGHGMGVHNHEAPWLAPGDYTPVAVGMVFSNEPGIYRPGIDGYRVINTMIVGEHGVEVPSRFQALNALEDRVIAI